MPYAAPANEPEGLESQLLRTAAQIIAQEGVDGLSMRNLGKAAGVSRTAAYYYFPDKAALVARLGQDGFERLGEAILAAGLRLPPGQERILAGFSAYLDFALDEPDLYRIMFSDVLSRSVTDEQATLGPFSSESARRTFGLLQHVVGTPFDTADPTSLANAQMLWAFAHGVSTLAIGNHLKGVEPHSILADGIAQLHAARQDAE